MSQIPPDMVRAGYRMQRTSQNVQTTIADVTAFATTCGKNAVQVKDQAGAAKGDGVRQCQAQRTLI